MTIIKYPFGAKDVLLLDAEAAQPLTIEDQYTIVDGVTTIALTNNRTLNLTIDPNVVIGAVLFVMSKTTAAETTVFGTGIIGPSFTGVAGKTITATFIFDGTNFIASGAQVQID